MQSWNLQLKLATVGLKFGPELLTWFLSEALNRLNLMRQNYNYTADLFFDIRDHAALSNGSDYITWHLLLLLAPMLIHMHHTHAD